MFNPEDYYFVNPDSAHSDEMKITEIYSKVEDYSMSEENATGDAFLYGTYQGNHAEPTRLTVKNIIGENISEKVKTNQFIFSNSGLINSSASPEATAEKVVIS